MPYLLAGLLIFLGVHSVRIVSEGTRTHLQTLWGAAGYKAVYTLLSLLGFALIVWGFGIVRETPTLLWNPPNGTRHLAGLLTLVAFVLLAAAYVPGNAIKARLHHPMVLGVKVWALAHLLTTGTLAHVVLFGSFLLWAVLCFRAARQRDRLAGVTYAAGTLPATALTALLGLALWAAFAFYLHGLLIGIRPLG